MSSNAFNYSDRDPNSGSEESHETEVTRPNRWQGPKSTWRELTKAERGLAASLDTLRDQNLGVHLFNAHSLKRKAREFEDAEESREEVSLLQDTRGFLPPKVWTAWPLPPEDVPRSGEEIGEEDELDIYTLKMRERNCLSLELEEVLTAVALKQAKEMFWSRELQQDAIGSQHLGNEGPDKALVLLEPDAAQDNSEESRDPSPKPFQDKERHGGWSASPPQLDRESKNMKDVKESNQPALEAVVSMDDGCSSALLRPSIRHSISKLDDVLIALHHARNTCHQYSKSDAGTDDEGRAMSVVSFASEDTVTTGKRPRGRPRKLQPNHIGLDETENASPTPSQLLRTKKSNRGRPQKDYPRLENETQQEYLVRVARIQKKPLPSFAPPIDPRPSDSKSPSRQFRTAPAHRATEGEILISRNKKLGLRDWSEVLGAAALTGFDPRVIERATKRCATLFGESLTMRILIEAPFAEHKEFVSTYQPGLIPKFDEEDYENSTGNEGSLRKKNTTQQITDSISKSKRKQSRFCPVANCPRRNKAFRDHYALKRHLQSTHKILDQPIEPAVKATIDSMIEDDTIPSDEGLDGGVHVDGFLKPLKPIMRQPKADRKENKKQIKDNSRRKSQYRLDGVVRLGESPGAESKSEDADSSHSSSSSSSSSSSDY